MVVAGALEHKTAATNTPALRHTKARQSSYGGYASPGCSRMVVHAERRSSGRYVCVRVSPIDNHIGARRGRKRSVGIARLQQPPSRPGAACGTARPQARAFTPSHSRHLNPRINVRWLSSALGQRAGLRCRAALSGAPLGAHGSLLRPANANDGGHPRLQKRR